MASFAKFARLRWDSSTGTPGIVIPKDTLVKVITSGKERHLVEWDEGHRLTRVWVDTNDLAPPPQTRYERLTGSDEI